MLSTHPTNHTYTRCKHTPGLYIVTQLDRWSGSILSVSSHADIARRALADRARISRHSVAI
jgi:hypothetical protein